jgi:hypothetical protein
MFLSCSSCARSNPGAIAHLSTGPPAHRSRAKWHKDCSDLSVTESVGDR